MLPGPGRVLMSGSLGGAVQTVRRTAQRNLTEGRKILPGEEVSHRTLSLPFAVDLARLQPLDEIVRLDVHKMDLIRRIKHLIRNPFAHRDAGD